MAPFENLWSSSMSSFFGLYHSRWFEERISLSLGQGRSSGAKHAVPNRILLLEIYQFVCLVSIDLLLFLAQ